MTNATRILTVLQKSGSITLIDSIALLGIVYPGKAISQIRKRYGKTAIRTSSHRYRNLDGQWCKQPEWHITDMGRMKTEKKPFPKIEI